MSQLSSSINCLAKLCCYLQRYHFYFGLFTLSQIVLLLAQLRLFIVTLPCLSFPVKLHNTSLWCLPLISLMLPILPKNASSCSKISSSLFHVHDCHKKLFLARFSLNNVWHEQMQQTPLSHGPVVATYAIDHQSTGRTWFHSYMIHTWRGLTPLQANLLRSLCLLAHATKLSAGQQRKKQCFGKNVLPQWRCMKRCCWQHTAFEDPGC